MRRSWAISLLTALCVAACGEETPTEVGRSLLPSDVIQSFEVVLEASRFLVQDTAFGGFNDPTDVDFVILANRWDDALDSRALARYTLPTTIVVTDSLGVVRVDSLPRYFAGEIVLQIDTLSSTTDPARLVLFRNTQDWDQRSATWTMRVDTPGTRLPWTVPGGSPGIRVDTTTWTPGVDSVKLDVDSATLALWADTTSPQRGAIIGVETVGARLRTGLPLLRVRARSSLNRDTIVTLTMHAPQRTFIFQPAPGTTSAQPRVGGTPLWRSFFRLRERLDTVTVPCPGAANCRIALGNASISTAVLRLQPVPSPRGLAPERGLTFGVHIVLPTPGVPLQRWPVSELTGANATPVPPSSFMTAGGPVVELPVTDLILGAVQPPTADSAFRPTYFGLLPVSTRTFGFGTFAEMPSLRLVITTAKELQL